jgi:hypothetical protein
MQIVQRITQQEYRLRRQLQQSDTADMFGENSELPLNDGEYIDNRMMAKQYLLKRLSKQPIMVDYETWADFLEESDLYPGDLQAAMKELVKDGLVKNIDADVSRRRKKLIKPNWPNKSERWRLV